MKTIIAGSRSLTDPLVLEEAVEEARAQGIRITEVVSGKARGVDRLGEHWAKAHGVPVAAFPAQWGRYGRRAGPIRNGQMVAYADALIAVWDGKSRGTANVIRQARRRGLRVFVKTVASVAEGTRADLTDGPRGADSLGGRGRTRSRPLVFADGNHGSD